MDFMTEARESLDKLIAFYSEAYEIKYNVEAAGMTVPVMAQMHSRQQRSILGFSINREGPEASEYIFFIIEETFGMDVLNRAKELVEYAQQEYVKLSKDHAYSFLSVVILADNAEKDAIDSLKRYKFRRDHHGEGWINTRVAVFAKNGGFCNRDGIDLKKMLQKVIA